MSDIYSLFDEVSAGRFPHMTKEYKDKMIHQIPDAPVYDRAKYLLSAAKDRVVLDFGATGPMADALAEIAKVYYSTDVINQPDRENFFCIDVDKVSELPQIDGLELVIAGEVLEHLSNAGHFLDLLHAYGIPVVLTVPNAFSKGSNRFLAAGIECVNKEHVSWYSYHTLSVLVVRHNFKVVSWGWYNGQPITAEGLIFLMEPANGRT